MKRIGLVGGVWAIIAACSGTNAVDESLSIGGLAGVPDDARAWVESTVRPLASESEGIGRLLNGQLYDLGGSATSPRYIFYAMGTPYGENNQIFLIVLDRSLPGDRSSPYDTGVLYDEYNFRSLERRDLDEDGLVDFAYCTWSDDPGGPMTTAVGHGPDGWYSLDLDLSAECGPQDSP